MLLWSFDLKQYYKECQHYKTVNIFLTLHGTEKSIRNRKVLKNTMKIECIPYSVSSKTSNALILNYNLFKMQYRFYIFALFAIQF